MHVQKISNSGSSVYPITVGKIVNTIMKKILEVKKVDYSKVSVFLKSRIAANAFFRGSLPSATKGKRSY